MASFYTPPQSFCKRYLTWLLVLVVLCAPTLLFAQEPSNSRIALVIGNAGYTGAIPALANPRNDAQDFAAKLQVNGWRVIVVQDLGRRDMSRRLNEFRDQLKASPGATALFYYAGHGVQVDGKNYLLPIGEVFENADDVKENAQVVDRVVDILTEAKVRQSVIILDACRDNPFAGKSRSIGSSRGLSVVPANESAEEGSAVIFATAANDTAADGDGRNGIFTAALLKNIDSGLDLANLFKAVRAEVRTRTGGKQNPSIVTSGLLTSLYLAKPTVVPTPTPTQIATPAPTVQPVALQQVVDDKFKLVVKGPEGINVLIDGATVGQTPFETILPKANYKLELSHADWVGYTQLVVPAVTGITIVNPTLTHTVQWQYNDLMGKKRPLEERLGLVNTQKTGWVATGTVAWITAGVGVAAVVAGVLLGNNARGAYDGATTTADIAAARSMIDTANIVSLSGIFGGGAGLLTGLITLIGTPNSAPIEKQITDIDVSLKQLEASK